MPRTMVSGAAPFGIAARLRRVLRMLSDRVHADADRGARFWELSDDLLVIVSRDGHVERVNPAWTRLLGWTTEELLAAPITDLIHPEDRPELAAKLGALLADRTGSAECRARYRCRDGSYRSSLWSVTTTAGDGLLYAIGRDVTDADRATEELRRSQHFLDSVLDNIPSIVYVKDVETGRCVSLNRAGERILGVRREELIGRPIDEFVDDGDARSRMADAERRALQTPGLVTAVSQEYPGPDGETRILDTRKVAIANEDGTARHLVGISEDVTERRAAERETESAREEAERANLAKSEFLSRMSHELRTPLNAVIGFGQLLELDELTGDQRESVTQILKAGRHLLDLINEVLDISRIEAGAMSVSLEPVHLGSALADALSLIRPLADAAGVTLLADPGESSRLSVHADNQRLKQVLINILSNAVKYNRSGGEVTVSCTAPTADRVTIAVSDTGVGMTEVQLERAFTPFDRLGAERTEIEGTGLGLSLSRSLLQEMSGTISARSVPGEGTTMLIELCAARSAEQPMADGAARSPAIRQIGRGAHSVLYIEDNLVNLRLVERALAGERDVRLIGAMQGKLGLDLAAQHLPDLIILDLHLPDVHGSQVLTALKANPLTAKIPVLVLSADATPRQVDELLHAGATRYLTKPIDVAYLRDLVRSAVSAAASPAPADADATVTQTAQVS